MSIFPKSQYVYLEQSDMISYSATLEQHTQIERLLHASDNKAKEALVKITLFSTSKNKLKSYGSTIKALSFSLDGSLNSVFNNLTNTKSPTEININKNANFSFTLFAMQQHGLVDIYQEPTIRISNGKEALVKSGLNIGYLQSTTSIQENQKTTTDQIKYRDVGIQLKVFPKIKDNWVHLDLDIISEELLSLKDNIPTTQKITYKSSVTVTKGKPLLLTGIKKTSSKFERDGVPLLSSIPLLGELFKKTTTTGEERNINILIEVL
jgi:type II secretory pathway component GspD/PulD (secretin)